MEASNSRRHGRQPGLLKGIDVEVGAVELGGQSRKPPSGGAVLGRATRDVMLNVARRASQSLARFAALERQCCWDGGVWVIA